MVYVFTFLGECFRQLRFLRRPTTAETLRSTAEYLSEKAQGPAAAGPALSVGDDMLRTRLGKQGAARATRRFQIERASTSFLEWFKEIRPQHETSA